MNKQKIFSVANRDRRLNCYLSGQTSPVLHENAFPILINGSV